MAAKTSTLAALGVLTRLRPSSKFPKLTELSCIRQRSSASQSGPYPGGASLQSLPGNRFLPGVLTASTPSWVPFRMRGTRKADVQISMNLGVCGIESTDDFTPLDDEKVQQEVAQQINYSLDQGNAGRLYSVVYIRGIQHKVTVGDLLIVKYDFPPNVGDRIRLEKVLAVGGKDFTLIGQPLLSRNVVRVDATVVEKTLSHNRVWFVYQKRRNFKKFHLYREMYTVLAINSIQVAKLPDQAQQLQGEDAQLLD